MISYLTNTISYGTYIPDNNICEKSAFESGLLIWIDIIVFIALGYPKILAKTMEQYPENTILKSVDPDWQISAKSTFESGQIFLGDIRCCVNDMSLDSPCQMIYMKRLPVQNRRLFSMVRTFGTT